MPHPPDDEALIAALRLASGLDPVPERVSAAARAAFALRLPGAAVARPVAVPAPSGVRSAGRDRLLRFGADGLVLDLEIEPSAGLVDLAGQITPIPGREPWSRSAPPPDRVARPLRPAGSP
nr:hypothetical protein GCM10020093_044670 [Planobispora longispora]